MYVCIKENELNYLGREKCDASRNVDGSTKQERASHQQQPQHFRGEEENTTHAAVLVYITEPGLFTPLIKILCQSG